MTPTDTAPESLPLCTLVAAVDLALAPQPTATGRIYRKNLRRILARHVQDRDTAMAIATRLEASADPGLAPLARLLRGFSD